MLALPLAAQAPYVVADLNSTLTRPVSSAPRGFATDGALTLFFARQDGGGFEPWSFRNGQLTRIKDINPGSANSSDHEVASPFWRIAPGLFLFVANDPSGWYLWAGEILSSDPEFSRRCYPDAAPTAWKKRRAASDVAATRREFQMHKKALVQEHYETGKINKDK